MQTVSERRSNGILNGPLDDRLPHDEVTLIVFMISIIAFPLIFGVMWW